MYFLLYMIYSNWGTSTVCRFIRQKPFRPWFVIMPVFTFLFIWHTAFVAMKELKLYYYWIALGNWTQVTSSLMTLCQNKTSRTATLLCPGLGLALPENWQCLTFNSTRVILKVTHCLQAHIEIIQNNDLKVKASVDRWSKPDHRNPLILLTNIPPGIGTYLPTLKELSLDGIVFHGRSPIQGITGLSGA